MWRFILKRWPPFQSKTGAASGQNQIQNRRVMSASSFGRPVVEAFTFLRFQRQAQIGHSPAACDGILDCIGQVNMVSGRKPALSAHFFRWDTYLDYYRLRPEQPVKNRNTKLSTCWLLFTFAVWGSLPTFLHTGSCTPWLLCSLMIRVLTHLPLLFLLACSQEKAINTTKSDCHGDSIKQSQPAKNYSSSLGHYSIDRYKRLKCNNQHSNSGLAST